MANAFWPDIHDIESAKKACHAAAVGAFFVAAITGLVAAIAMASSTPIAGIDGSAFVDAAIFAVLGFFLRRCSRTAAVIALVLFIIERIFMMAQGGAPAGLIVAIILIVYFIGGVRGAFTYHRLMAQQNAQAKATGGTIG